MSSIKAMAVNSPKDSTPGKNKKKIKKLKIGIKPFIAGTTRETSSRRIPSYKNKTPKILIKPEAKPIKIKLLEGKFNPKGIIKKAAKNVKAPTPKA